MYHVIHIDSVTLSEIRKSVIFESFWAVIIRNDFRNLHKFTSEYLMRLRKYRKTFLKGKVYSRNVNSEHFVALNLKQAKKYFSHPFFFFLLIL